MEMDKEPSNGNKPAFWNTDILLYMLHITVVVCVAIANIPTAKLQMFLAAILYV